MKKSCIIAGSVGKDETDVRWSLNPTAAERLCEHANVSLTERLRRDFGIDATESDEEDKGSSETIVKSKKLKAFKSFCLSTLLRFTCFLLTDEGNEDSSGGESPPPPPPPPPPPKPSGKHG